MLGSKFFTQGKMRRFLLFSGIAVAVIIILGWLGLFLMNKHTKSFSPENEVAFDMDDLTVSVVYNRPYKKGREIFGELVPYDAVWRTGANEATIFDTNKDLMIKGSRLKAGKYTLWTVPNKDTWTVIFNSEFGQWGINSKGEANRNPDRDVLTIEVPVSYHETSIEQFTISFEKVGDDAEMVMLWDTTVVAVPISIAK